MEEGFYLRFGQPWSVENAECRVDLEDESEQVSKGMREKGARGRGNMD